MYYSREWSLESDELLDFEVAHQVRLRDLLRVHRVFQFIAHFVGHQLVPRLQQTQRDPRVATLIHQSAIVSLPYDQLRSFVTGVLPNDRVDHVLDFLTWSPGPGDVFDVQYRPLIRGDRSYFVPMSIAAFSNILRNAVKKASKPLNRDPTEERFPTMLRRAFQGVTPATVGCVRYDFAGNAGELDAVCG